MRVIQEIVRQYFEELPRDHDELPSQIRQQNLPCKDIPSVQAHNKTAIH